MGAKVSAGIRLAALGSAFVVGLGVSTVARPAAAQLTREASGFGGAFEVKAGPYLPALAQSDGGAAAFVDLYGADRTRVLVNFGLEFQAYRSQWLTLSVGATAGYIAWDGSIPTPEGGDFEPGEAGSSTFTVVPLTFTVGGRLDYLVHRTPIPVAPYIRAGLAYHLWWNSAPLQNDEDPNGGRPGFVATAGIAFPLNVIDRTSAANLYNSVGVRTTYIFIEGQLSIVDGFGDGNLDLSDTTWFAGMMVEF